MARLLKAGTVTPKLRCSEPCRSVRGPANGKESFSPFQGCVKTYGQARLLQVRR